MRASGKPGSISRNSGQARVEKEDMGADQAGAQVIRIDVLEDSVASLDEARRHHVWAQDTMRPAGPRYRDSLHANRTALALLEEIERRLPGLPRGLRTRAEDIHREAHGVAAATHALCVKLCRRPAPVLWLLPRLSAGLTAKAANDTRAA